MLSIDEIFQMAEEKNISPPAWKWKPLKTYNGFTHEQRVRGWQAMHLAVKMGIIPPASDCACEICGVTAPVTLQYHSENYGNLAEHVLCRHCHKLLHQRHKYPEKWRELMRQRTPNKTWYLSLKIEGV